jgi:hypothetical protein
MDADLHSLTVTTDGGLTEAAPGANPGAIERHRTDE